MSLAVQTALLLLILVTAIGVVRLRNLFGATILLGIYSLLMALSWTNMEAYDVAFTEAAVGAGISTILLIGALIFTGSKEGSRQPLQWPALILVAAVGALMAYGANDFPNVGDPQAPIHEGVARHYLEDSYHETHVPNMVTSVLASYRGYDTMFETAVIFAAGITLILLLRNPREGKPLKQPLPEAHLERHTPGEAPSVTESGELSLWERPEPPEALAPLREQAVLAQTTKLLIPFIVLYGMYVITHGEIGPGGGFQGGVILAAAYILYALVFGSDAARQNLPQRWTDRIAALGVLLYAGVGVATMLLGGSFLDYHRLGEHPQHAQELGMTLVEAGVGLTVASVMITLFSEVAEIE